MSDHNDSAEEVKKYMGKMHIVFGVCGHVVAACWVTGNARDAEAFARTRLEKGQRLETIDRYEGDPMPEWCWSSCHLNPWRAGQ